MLKADIHGQVDYAEGLKATAAQQQTDLGLSSREGTEKVGKHVEALKVGIRKRSLTESSSQTLLQLDHPCLQSGYSKPYRRLVHAKAANPARVQLIGK